MHSKSTNINNYWNIIIITIKKIMNRKKLTVNLYYILMCNLFQRVKVTMAIFLY